MDRDMQIFTLGEIDRIRFAVGGRLLFFFMRRIDCCEILLLAREVFGFMF